jgi:Na+-transporting NADH:ubiquinone oxidoreductase subunit B
MRVAAGRLPSRGADGLVALQVIALTPPLAAAVWLGGLPVLGVLVTSLVVVTAWDVLFAALRHRPFKPYGITTAAIFTLFAPPEMPLWHLAVVLSLGTVIGEHVFGGRGFAFLSPAAVALALGLVSLPNMALNVPDASVALACLPGAVLLLTFGVLSVPISLTFLAVVALAFNTTTPAEVVGLLTTCSIGLLFLVCDPTSTAVTGLGRVIHGALAGALVWFFSGANTVPPPDALVFAALMTSLFAPLIDHGGVAVNAAWRSRRYG